MSLPTVEKAFEIPAYDWKPHRFQLPAWKAMVRPDFRRAYLCWPRRHGKDSISGHITAVKAMQRVGNYAIMLPQINQARRALWEGLSHLNMPRIEEFFPPQIVDRKDSQSMMLWLTSGSTVQLLGSDSYESSIGSGFTGIVYSEAALTTIEASQYLRPMVEFNKGWEIYISTPRGKNHFWRGLLGAMEDMKGAAQGIFADRITAFDAGVFTHSDLERIRRDYIREMGKVLGEALFAQEYMVSAEAAVVGAVWGAELEEMELEGRVRPCKHDRRFPVHTSCDIGVSDSTVFLFWQEINSEYRLIDAYEATGIGLDSYVEMLKAKHWDNGYHYGRHYAPHDIQQREWAKGVSRKDEARRLGLEFARTPQTRVKTQISVGAQLLRQAVVNSDSPQAMAALDHWKNWRYPTIKNTGELNQTPLHDEHSHASSALCTFAINVASKLGVVLSPDPALHSSEMGHNPHQKFDPRELGDAPFSHERSVSRQMRGTHAPMRGAFG